MSDWKEDDDSDDTKNMSLDDLEEIENEQEHQSDPYYNEEDWGDSFDDLDSEAWDRQYGQGNDEEIETDPWELA